MAVPEPLPALTLEDYLAIEEQTGVRHEWVNGVARRGRNVMTTLNTIDRGQTGGLPCTIALVVGVFACRPAGECEPDIVATGDQRAAIEETYARMREQVVLPLCARRIEVVDVIDFEGFHPKGSFSHRTFGIELASQSVDNLRSTLRHELCHALYVQHRLSSGMPEFQDHDPEEDFAMLCEAGPVAADLLLRSDVLTPVERQRFRFVADAIWPAAPSPTPLPVAVVDPVAWPVGIVLEPRPLVSFTDPDFDEEQGWPLLREQGAPGEMHDAYALDPWTGRLERYRGSPFVPSDTMDTPEDGISVDDLDSAFADSGFRWPDVRLTDFRMQLIDGKILYGSLIQQEGANPTWLPMHAPPTLRQQLALRYDEVAFQVAYDGERGEVSVSAWDVR